MFDDPKKELRRLQEELLAEEEETWDEEEELDLDALDELLGEDEGAVYEECFQEDYREEYDQEPFYRNHANNYGQDVRNFANNYGKGQAKQFDDAFDFDAEDPEEDEVLYREDYRKGKKAAKKGNTGLIILAAAETLAIIAIAIWWLSWLL